MDRSRNYDREIVYCGLEFDVANDLSDDAVVEVTEIYEN